MSLAEWWKPDGSLELPPDLAYDAWTELGGVLVKIEKGILWALGTWWLYGEHKYGEAAAQAIPTGYAAATLRGAAYVVERFPPGVRVEDLPFAHHRAVAALPPAQAQELLNEAKAGSMSEKDLRERVRGERSRTAFQQEAERVAAKTVPNQPGPVLFPVVVVDPPWEDAKVDDLCDWKLPIGSQAVVFLWTPIAQSGAALSVLDAWGCSYRAQMVWPQAELQIGRTEENLFVTARHQLVLIGGRGDLLPKVRPGSVLDDDGSPPRSRQAALLLVIAEMYPDLPVCRLGLPLFIA